MTGPERHADGTFARTEASFDAVYAEIKRLDQLRGADQVALSAALLAAKTAVDAALAAAEKAVAAALIAAKEAVNKAELAQQRTNEGQNEFRGQLKDQASTLMPRVEHALVYNALVEKIDGMQREFTLLRQQVAVGPPSLSTLQAESDNRRGKDQGTGATWATVLGVATIAVIALGVLVSILIRLPIK